MLWVFIRILKPPYGRCGCERVKNNKDCSCYHTQKLLRFSPPKATFLQVSHLVTFLNVLLLKLYSHISEGSPAPWDSHALFEKFNKSIRYLETLKSEKPKYFCFRPFTNSITKLDMQSAT